ncbi:hypothetical protein C8Q76DRAFT_798165 [Earliella scabrosa]|nr:hypothetical protein C8Q76DRAFT_798165 [Earliella scabrosa]
MTPSGAATRAALRAVLDRVHSGSALLSVTIIVRPSNENPGWSYGVDRTGLVDYLLGEEMRAILSRFPALCQLDFGLWEHDGEHDAGWWTAEIARRLPDSCHAAVSVKLDLRPQGYYEHLWHARKKIEAAEKPQPVEQDPEMQTVTEAGAEEATENR